MVYEESIESITVPALDLSPIGRIFDAHAKKMLQLAVPALSSTMFVGLRCGVNPRDGGTEYARVDRPK